MLIYWRDIFEKGKKLESFKLPADDDGDSNYITNQKTFSVLINI